MIRKLYQTSTPGYRALMGEIRTNDSDYDTTVGWLFGIAEVFWLRFGEKLPEFEPSPIPRSVDDLEESYPASMVLDFLDDGDVTEDDMRRAYTVMSRYADWLRLAGRDY